MGERFGAILRMKLNVIRKRKAAKIIFSVMSGWQVAGQTYRLLKGFGHRIQKLQRWWRACAQRLQEQRTMISRRWLRLERVELQSKPSMSTDGNRNDDSEPVSEAVRMEFIQNELRARRYLVLPQVLLWETEVIKWRRCIEDWAATRAAHRALGILDPGTQGFSSVPPFAWPPSRPSHLPPRHPNHEAR